MDSNITGILAATSINAKKFTDRITENNLSKHKATCLKNKKKRKSKRK